MEMQALIVEFSLFILVFLSYYLVIESILVFLAHVYFNYNRLSQKISPKLNLFSLMVGEKDMGRGYKLGVWARIFVSVGFVSIFYLYSLWTWENLMLWKSPLLTGIVFAHSAFNYFLLGNSKMPLFRHQSITLVLLLLPALLLLLVSSVGDLTISNTVFKWGVIAAEGLVIIGSLYSLKSKGKVTRHQSIRERRRSLKESFENIDGIKNIVNDAKEREEIIDVLKIIEERHEQSAKALKNGDLDAAEALLLQAEKEVEEINNIFRNRISLSLRDELEGRLNQAEKDLEELEEEFTSAGIEGEKLTGLKSEIQELRTQLNSIDLTKVSITEEKLKDLINEFDGLFSDIRDLRTALRFYRNVNSALDDLKSDIQESWEYVEIAKVLGLSTVDTEEVKEKIDESFEKFKNQSIKSPSPLITKFYNLQQEIAEFESQVSSLKTRIENEWEIVSIPSHNLEFYVPKTCKTTAPKPTAVVSRNLEKTKPISFTVEGTRIEVPSERQRKLEMQNEQLQIAHFNIAGKKGGEGNLQIKFDGLDINKGFSIPIIPTIREIGQRSFIFSTPIAALSIITLVYSGVPLSKSGPIGIAVGGLFGMGVFLIDYLRLRRPYTTF